MTAKTRVLLCDDSRAMRVMTASILEENGFEIAGEADSGLAAISQYKATRPDVVLLDLVMPKMDGKAALREILDFDPKAVVIVLSSLGAQSDIEKCLKVGAKSYLQKPIEPEALLRVIGEAAGG
ncbi:response regulator [Pseudomarimonas salicorniae]|uniref:Response regulator n=1 Tax=Pseudomarimonas salicorniae TaxID=2933270 RepID=A0ABT0GE49_9GAMM|nr:response regulator [Lysobacter sp. CAU 1642]MCK7592801.1 response regulator [Lysobacter sp. CAU 1642]